MNTLDVQTLDTDIQFTVPIDEGIVKSRERLLHNLEMDVIQRLRGSNNEVYKQIMMSATAFIKADTNRYLAYSHDDPSRVSYAQIPAHRYDIQRRVKTTIERYLRRIVGISSSEIDDGHINIITRPLFGRPPMESDIKIVSGRDIQRAYARQSGGWSCMVDNGGKYTHLYADNPDKVQMVILGNDIARALLFKCDGGEYVLDRIYPNQGEHVEMLIQWAKSKGYIFRLHQLLTEAGDASPLSDGDIAHFVTLDASCLMYPYLDTFRYGVFLDDCRFTLRLTNDPQQDSKYQFQDTGGRCDNYRRMQQVACQACGVRVREDHMWRARDNRLLCRNCYNLSRSKPCVDCGTMVHEDNQYLYSGRVYCEGCFRDKYYSCANCGNGVPHDEAIEVEQCDWLCPECADRKATECVVCGDFYYTNNMAFTKGGDAYCSEHADEHTSVCSYCGDRFHNDDIITAEDTQDDYCKEHAESELYHCDACDEYFESEFEHDGICDDCFGDDEEEEEEEKERVTNESH